MAGRKKIKAAHEYSQNSSTKKNLAARDKKVGEEFDLLKDKNATSKASSYFWKNTFEPKISKILNAPSNALQYPTLKDELRIQSNNTAAGTRFDKETHWTQQAANRPANAGKVFPSKDTFFADQKRVFLLEDACMPPKFIIDKAKIKVAVDEDGNITELTAEMTEADEEMAEPTAEMTGSTAEITEAGKEGTDALEADLKTWQEAASAAASLRDWRNIQKYWRIHLLSALRKIGHLARRGFRVYLLHMGNKKFLAYANWVNPIAKCLISESKTWASRLQRSKAMRLAYENTSVAYKGKIDIDEDSGLPIPPFWMLFSRFERIVMSLIHQCQLNGRYSDCQWQFAKDGTSLPLPRPYSTVSLEHMGYKFPLDYCDADGAEHLLTMVVDDRNIIPKQIGQWIELANVGIATRYEDENHMDEDHMDVD